MPQAEPNQKSLFAQLNEHFSLDELRELCFELGIDPESLDLRRKGSFVVDLLRTCEQRSLLPNLVQAVVEKRPFLRYMISHEFIDLGLPVPPFWQRPAFLIPLGILIVLTIVTTLVVNVGGDNFIASQILPPTPTASATPMPTIPPTPMATPRPIATARSGEQLIVIATFARTEGVDDAHAQAEIQRRIQETAADLDIPNLRVVVVLDIIPINYNDQSEETKRARDLATGYGAGIVIWGQETSVRITTHFLSLRNEPEEIWNQQFSWPRPTNYVEHMTEIMPHYMELITLTAIGELYFRNEEYTKATEILNFLVDTTYSSLLNDEIQNSDTRMSIALVYSRLGDIYLITDPFRANSYYCLSKDTAPQILLSDTFPQNLNCSLPEDIN